MSDVELGGKVRTLTAEELGIGFTAKAVSGAAASSPDAPEIVDTDPLVQEIVELLHAYSGVLLSGAPGTSKTYLAHAVAIVLAEGRPNRYAFVQFHPSYQYEDFMEGYRPQPAGGFERKPGLFMQLCEDARYDPDNDYVMVIDELSRGDAARIFGEALTYLEHSKRGMSFRLPSGEPGIVPPNVRIVATMNPLDRGVDEVDAAFERRFAKKTMAPDPELLRERLTQNQLDGELLGRLVAWFRDINGQPNPAAHLGHAFFWDVTDGESLRNAWEYQVKHHVDRAFRHDPQTGDRLREKWSSIFDASDEAE